MSKKIFLTFSASNVTELNGLISEYAKNNNYEEIKRSAPSVVFYERFLSVFVTSTFVEKKTFVKKVEDPKEWF